MLVAWPRDFREAVECLSTPVQRRRLGLKWLDRLCALRLYFSPPFLHSVLSVCNDLLHFVRGRTD